MTSDEFGPPGRAHPPADAAWHALDRDEAAARLGVRAAEGLAPGEAEARLRSHGPNRLAESPPRSAGLRLLDQFRNGLILLLVGAAGLAAAIGDVKDAAVILVVVMLNAVLGFVQEGRAARAVAALKQMLSPRTRVRRADAVLECDAADLVPGDIVLLEGGDRVPADGRLVAAHALEIDEAALTGESQPVAKLADVALPEATPLADRRNLAFMNTLVTRGRGELLVTATGMRTEMGRLAAMIAEVEEPATPLQIELGSLGRRVAAIGVVATALVLLLGLLRGQPFVEIALTAISLAVAAIPEGLPAVVTVTLAIGMHRMARHRAIVKRLASVETLGCTTLICSDKTGTLTLNEMTARAFVFRGRHHRVDGLGYRAEGGIRWDAGAGGDPPPDLAPLALPLALCTESDVRDGRLVGDPTEGALLVLAEKAGLERAAVAARMPRVGELPFDPETRLMATFHLDGELVRIFAKGAPEALLPRCGTWLGPDGVTPLDSGTRQQLEESNHALADEALRVLAVASAELPAGEFHADADLRQHLADLTFTGLIGLMDPPRPEVRAALALCRRAGIEIKMITGDHPRTAAAIARELGLKGKVVTGSELDGMEAADLAKRLDSIGVFARVVPEHKVAIVRAAREQGHVVAMTGDGVNDAPALRAADIGVAMGATGTEVTKEAAKMVLTDDNFATIVRAVEEGRTIYDNIGKFVAFQLSTNFGAVLSVFGAPLLGLPLPFDPVQLLWVNIIMDGPPAMALGVDPPQPGTMKSPPRRRDDRILSGRRLLRLLTVGLVMTAGTLGVLWYALQTGPREYARTLAFTTFVAFQIFNAFNVRSQTVSAFGRHSLTNPSLLVSLAAVGSLQVIATNWGPAQAVFDTAELSARDGNVALGVASSILLLEEARKLWWRWAARRRGTGAP